MGRGALMAKVDVKSAYRLVPVHPEDRLLLGMSWEGDIFVDTVLPFGLRSAPKIFTAPADALEWVTRQSGVETVIHYLDDFFLLGEPDSEQCAVYLQLLLGVFTRLKVPVAMEKLEGPVTRLTFLGIHQAQSAGGYGKARRSGHAPDLPRDRIGLGPDVPPPPPGEARRVTNYPGAVAR